MKTWQKFVFGELSWKRLLRSILSIYVILLVIAVSLGDYLIFVPPKVSYSEDDANITLINGAIEGEKLATYYRPAKEGMPTLLWSHGNAEDLSSTSILDLLHQAGFGIYAYDYPGYGLSSGNPSDHSCYSAIELAYEDLTETHQTPTNDIILVGQSVGSGPACYLASTRPASAIILVTPLTSIYRVAFNYPIFPRDRFPNIDRIKDIKIPLMVIHGNKDEVIPQSHGMALIKAHSGEHVFHDIKGRGHNNIHGETPEELTRTIQRFKDFATSF